MSKLKVKIMTMDTELEFEILAKTTGKDLFVQVSKTLGLHEIWFFGIMYRDENSEEVWIDNSKKAMKDLKNHIQKLHYRVKYFPEDIGDELIEDNTIKYFFLQVRAGIMSEKIYCPPDTSVLLASYALQARHADYDSNKHNVEFLNKQKLLPQKIYDQHKMKPEEFNETILNMWIKHRGMIKEDAMMEYLKLAQNLDMYGVCYFDITNKKGTQLVLGVHAIGLSVYTADDRMNPTVMFPWSEIKNINYRDIKFTIRSVDKKSVDFVFFSSDARTNKRILTLGVGNHYLYVRRRKPPTLEVTQMKTKALEQRKVLLEQRNKLQHEITAREEAERREKQYQDQIRALKEEMENNKKNLIEAQCVIEKLKEQLHELQLAKDELEKQRGELQELTKRLEETKNMEAEERQKLEDEIRAKQNEVLRIQEEVEIKNQQTSKLQEEVAEAHRIEEELRAQQLAEAARREEEKELESLPENAKDDLPELALVNEQLKEQLRTLQEKLEQSRDESKDTNLDKIHRENVSTGKDKYKTLAQIRKGNTVRRVDLFENL